LAAEELIDDPKKLELLFDDAITRGLEGIVAKRLDGTYQPGARGWNWIKFKRSYSSKHFQLLLFFCIFLFLPITLLLFHLLFSRIENTCQ
jgi:hypothetical protein